VTRQAIFACTCVLSLHSFNRRWAQGSGSTHRVQGGRTHSLMWHVQRDYLVLRRCSGIAIGSAGKSEVSQRVKRLDEGSGNSVEDKEPGHAARPVVSCRPSGYFNVSTLNYSTSSPSAGQWRLGHFSRTEVLASKRLISTVPSVRPLSEAAMLMCIV